MCGPPPYHNVHVIGDLLLKKKNPAAHIINKLPAGISSVLPHHEKLCRAKSLANII